MSERAEEKYPAQPKQFFIKLVHQPAAGTPGRPHLYFYCTSGAATLNLEKQLGDACVIIRVQLYPLNISVPRNQVGRLQMALGSQIEALFSLLLFFSRETKHCSSNVSVHLSSIIHRRNLSWIHALICTC